MGVVITRINGKIKNDRDFYCNSCGVKYLSIAELGTTINDSSGYKKFICEYCYTGKPKQEVESV